MTGPTERTVAVTGSTGMIGEALVRGLVGLGYRVLRVTRGASEAADTIRWDPAAGTIESDRLEGVYAVVHLAGESIAGVRWTAEKKRRILASREGGTLLLSRTLAALGRPPAALVSMSAIGYYGDRGTERLTERSSLGKGFLASVCVRWEQATEPARAAGVRTVVLRTGQVLSPKGGLLGVVLLPFRAGLGGRVGAGTQYMSWIDLDDVVGLILHAIATPTLAGPVNATAPGAVTNAAFTDILGRVLGRPTLVPVPALALRALLGEMGEELVLSGQRVLPERALDSGYQFRFPELEGSLRHQLGRSGHGLDAGHSQEAL